MDAPIPLRRRVGIVARWPIGIALTCWRYMWRTTPLHRGERRAPATEAAVPPLPAGAAADGVQRPQDGVGPLFHRRYRARIRDADATPRELFARLLENPDVAAPSEFATFVKTGREPGPMRAGDEYVVRMPGPWDGPVRAVEVGPTSFRLVTLRGHLEAGQILFSAAEDDGMLAVEIESWATSGDRLSRLLYQRLRMSKEIQLHMWTSFLERAAALAGGRLTGGIEIRTVRYEGGAGLSPGARRALDAARRTPENFDPAEAAAAPARLGWRRDERWQGLPSEAPGEPVPGGPFEVARGLVRDYAFSPPQMVRATFDPAEPLEGRPMLLELRYAGLRLRAGVRVARVIDEVADGPEGQERVWGWAYRTLRGHLEAGERAFEVRKGLATGEVRFRTHAVSRVASRNPLWRLVFRALGRRRQAAWARRVCERMAALTQAAMDQAIASSRRTRR